MYSEWTEIQVSEEARQRSCSVLAKFPSASSGAVVHAVVQSLAQSLGLSSGQPEVSTLHTDVEVNWCMEVMCHGLNLSLKEHEAIKNCVHVYCEWLVALIPEEAKICVPRPVISGANQYSRRILWHLYNLFSPRTQEQLTSDVASRQALLCHRVLRRVQSIATKSPMLEAETWQEILSFLLAINDVMLSDRQCKDADTEAHLCERLLGVLFQVWLMACHRSSFPSPSFWKTLQCLCLRWRHRQILIDQWRKIQLIMTGKLCREILDSDYPQVKIEDGDKEYPLVAADMSGECLGQAWYRMLHTLGDLSQIAKDQSFSNGTLTHNSQELQENQAQIFYRTMASISLFVDVWLGRYSEDGAFKLLLPPSQNTSPSSAASASNASTGPPTPPSLRKSKQKAGQKLHITQLMQHKPPSAVSPVVTPTGGTQSPQFPQLEKPAERFNTAANVVRRLTLHPKRPTVNSLLHLYCYWLFEASAAPSEVAESAFVDSETESIQSQSSQSSQPEQPSAKSFSDSDSMTDSHLGLPSWSLEWGQAEALGTLCKILSSKTSDEEVLSVYLARFFIAVKHALSAQPPQEPPSIVMCSVVANAADLFKCDLESAALLVPAFVHALETVLAPLHSRSNLGHLLASPVPDKLLHNSAISILLSLLPLTLHSGSLQVPDQSNRLVTLASFRSRLLRILVSALPLEVDSLNTQTLLHGLMCAVLDQVEYDSNMTAASPGASEGSLKDESGTFSENQLLFTAIKTVCQSLTSSWKSDTSIVLTALDVLTVFARLRIADFANVHNYREYRQCVAWLCELIVWQSHRPSKDHSKELHSTIVAAFGCLTVWLAEHAGRFCDQDTLHSVMEVVELGISGSKSQAKSTDIPQLKQNKERKPLSKRVLQAAEAVLSTLMDHVGYFPNAAGPECPVSSLLNEQALLKDRVGAKFRYFYTQSHALIGVLEDPVQTPGRSNPSLTLLVRAPFGRHVWAMQLSNVPQSKLSLLDQAPVQHQGSAPAPMVLPRYQTSLPNKEQLQSLQKKLPPYFPPKVAEIPPCDIEKSIIPDPWNMPDNTISSSLLSMVEAQTKLEAACRREAVQRPTDRPCRPPVSQTSFQTARLFLMHFGFLAPHDSSTKPSQSLLSMRSSPELSKQLMQLDQLSARTADTVNVFYMKKGQTSAKEVLENAKSSSRVHPLYLEFLRTLGWPVDVGMHIGWTGNFETSWKVSGDTDLLDLPSNHGGSLYDGTHQVLYWADVLSEMAFVVPTIQEGSRRPSTSSLDRAPSKELSEGKTPPEKPPRSNMTLNLDKSKSSSRTVLPMAFEVKVMVVWLESFEDHNNFPLDQLLPYTGTGMSSAQKVTDVIVISVTLLQNGLFRLKVESRSANRATSVVNPSLDGLIVSRRTLGAVVRNIALNLCRRRRLDADPESCPAPHVKRRAKIQEIGTKFSEELPSAEFHSSLFERQQATAVEIP